jgi:predicted transposase/invertase (TIGR01784 family)
MTKSLTNTPTPKYLPTNDVIFKCLLGNPGNERITKSFLEHITGEEIEEISTNFKLELLKEKPKDKQMVADLIAKDKYLQKYIVEMQRKAI